jgi:hypothetical protein
MPLRLAARRALSAPAPTPLSRVLAHRTSKPPVFTSHVRLFHASGAKCSEFAQQNHYERLGIRHDATPREVKKCVPPSCLLPVPLCASVSLSLHSVSSMLTRQILLLPLQIAPPRRKLLAHRRAQLRPPLGIIHRALRPLPPSQIRPRRAPATPPPPSSVTHAPAALALQPRGRSSRIRPLQATRHVSRPAA